MSTNPKHQIWTISKIQRDLPRIFRNRLAFYAPLAYHMDYLGIGEATFTRAAEGSAVYRDGAVHTVPANIPRFEYSGENPLGLVLSSSEVLTYPNHNALDSGILIWFEEGVAKVAPLNVLNPFDNGNTYRGTRDVHITDLMRFPSAPDMTDVEIGQIVTSMSGAQTTLITNDWIFEAPAPASPTSRMLIRDPDVSALLLTVDGIPLKRVASSPGLMQYSISGRVVTFGAAFTGPIAVRALYRRSGVAGASFATEDLAGTKDGVNLSFSISQAPTDGVIIVVHHGIALHKVGAAPGLGQYTISGTSITLGGGAAPIASDDLWAFFMTAGSGFSVEDLGGTKDDNNTDFTISAGVIENTILGFHQGVSLTRVIDDPGVMEYKAAGTGLSVGTPPSAGGQLWAFLRTS